MQKTTSAKSIVEELEKSFLFKGITEQSLYLIAHELAKIIKIKKETIVYNMLKRSAFNDRKKRFKQELREAIKRNKKKMQTIDDEKFEENNDLKNVYKLSKECTQRINNDLLDTSEGLYVIMKGKCEVRNPCDNTTIGTIQKRDFFGESDFFQAMGYNYFGNIITAEDCEFIYIEHKNLNLISIYDRDLMIQNSTKNKQKMSKMVFQCAEIYGDRKSVV